jgi:hypothetical protein
MELRQVQLIFQTGILEYIQNRAARRELNLRAACCFAATQLD